MNVKYPISMADINKAHEIVKQYCHSTPVLSSESINKIAGCNIYFKCENFQKIGAFKMRGASFAISQLSEEQKKKGVVTHSSGNHAQAVALAAQLQNTHADIVMPKTAPQVKVKGVKTYGGNISFCEPTIQARKVTADEIIARKGAIFIPPFNDLRVITGQATCAKELIEEIENLDSIICPVGGGGLLAGTILAAEYFGEGVKVYAGEPQNVNDAYRSLKSGKIEKNQTTNTIADGLMTNLGELNFSIIQQGIENILEVSEEEITSAMRLIWERMKIIVEPSSAVALAAILKNKEIFLGQKLGIIITGGNVDLDSFFKAI